MKRLTDAELLEVLPPFLGITFALVLFGILEQSETLGFLALAVLFLVILRVRFLLYVGRLIHDSVKLLGNMLVHVVLGVMYLTLISLYAVIFRKLSPESVKKFRTPKRANSTYVHLGDYYQQHDFEKTW